MLKLIKGLYNKKVSSKGLAIFRILFSSTLFFEVLRIYNYKELYYGAFPNLEVSSSITVGLQAWLLVLIFLAFGFLSKIMTILNYALALFLLSQFQGLIYHMAYTYLGIGFLMMLFPLSKSFSIDALLKIKYKVTSSSDTKVTVLAYYLFVLVGIGFVYIDSIFFKLKTEVWMNGTGMWLPASLPHFTILKDQWLLNQKYLLLFFGYLTIVFEAIFCFLFFRKRFRIPLLIIGLGLHIGILIEFPIPYFAMGAIGVYMLLVPLKFWEIIPIFNIKTEKLKPAENPSSVTKFFNLLYFSGFSKKLEVTGYTIIIVMLLLLQFNSTFNFPASKPIERKALEISAKFEPFFYHLKQFKEKGRKFSKRYLGITAHGVFVDSHYNGFEKIYTLSYQDKLLPIYSNQGIPKRYLSSGSWVHYNFRVNRHVEKQTTKNLKDGLSRYAIYWSLENDIDLNNTEFDVLEKKVHYTFKWEKDLLQKNLSEPWNPSGILTFKYGKARLTLDKPLKNDN
ncbi:hypothetical protein [Patiriisocius hiemis]|uniref:HTTM-like domain-containing protein n=1 Tax=Patiriisocius hiemis TaxID=3075604 RepID=A0ABU2YCY1_9FLAO|nr:hypothetical protein [Constantimarinum sp. W242]MDT0556044.1 hypothetical protein [Constantimarinum sp. W242]